MTRVLVVDDEPPILRALRINLAARGYQVSTASDGASGLAAMARDPGNGGFEGPGHSCHTRAPLPDHGLAGACSAARTRA